MAVTPHKDRLCVVLVRTRNPLNIGAAARAMSNFGFERLRVVKPFEPAFREAKSAVGAAPVLAAAEPCESVADAVADCTLVVGTTAVGHRQLQQPLRSLREGAGLIRKRLDSGRVALLFGSEKIGLPNEDLAHCHWLMRIPTRAEHGSMNLAQAVAVCLYELIRESAVLPRPERRRVASGAAEERMTRTLLDALRLSGYEKPQAKSSTEAKVRRMVRRLNLQEDDAEVWLGMLRKIVRKLRG